MTTNFIEVSRLSVIGHLQRAQLTSDELERIEGTHELEVALNSRRAARMQPTELDETGRIYSVKVLHETLTDPQDDTNDTVKYRLMQLLLKLEGIDYFWLI